MPASCWLRSRCAVAVAFSDFFVRVAVVVRDAADTALAAPLDLSRFDGVYARARLASDADAGRRTPRCHSRPSPASWSAEKCARTLATHPVSAPFRRFPALHAWLVSQTDPAVEEILLSHRVVAYS